MGITIKDAQLVEELKGNEKLPVSDGSNIPKSVSIEQIKEFANKDIDIPTKVSELKNDSEFTTKKELEDAVNAIPIPDVSGQISAALIDYVKKVEGKGLSTNDFTNELKKKLEGITPYDPSGLEAEISKLETALNTLVKGNASNAIESFNEIVSFLDGISDSEDLDSIIASIEQQVASKYSKPLSGIPKADLSSDVQSSLNKAETALQEEQYKGTISAVDTNEEVEEPLNGVFETLPNGNIKLTINGVSKDFMPATPSGDSQHYVYEGHGAIYNDGDDYITKPEWANLVDDVEYNAKYGLNKITGTKVKVITYQGVDYDIYEQNHYTLGSAFKVWVVGIKSQDGTLIWDDSKIIHRKGRWLFNCIGDLTNDQMRDIVNQGVRYVTTPFCYAYMGSQYSGYKGRTNMPSYGGNVIIQNSNLQYTFYYALYENALMGTQLYSETVFQTNHSDLLGGYIRHLTGAQIKASSNNITFKGGHLSTIKFCDANKSFNVASSIISKNSILQAIETEKATSVITIGLHSSAFNRISNEPDIVEALNNHPNVTLATI